MAEKCDLVNGSEFISAVQDGEQWRRRKYGNQVQKVTSSVEDFTFLSEAESSSIGE
jgi:hypothetical protein